MSEFQSEHNKQLTKMNGGGYTKERNLTILLNYMDNYLLEKLTAELKISPFNILRENLEIAFLDKVSQSSLSEKILFYGGTSLRLAYGSPRFSEDVDFLMIKKTNESELGMLVENLASEYTGLSLKDIKMKRNTLFALLNLTHPVFKHPMNVKIEISRKTNGIKTEYLPLKSPCSNLTPIILTATPESLKRLKEQAVRQRNDPKDWFDLWYLSKYLKEPFVAPVNFPFDPKEFRRELKRFLPQNRWRLIEQIYV